MGAMLLNYLSRPNLRQHGVEIRGEAVVQGEHTLYLIVESSDQRRVREFLQPFAQAGPPHIHLASTLPPGVANAGPPPPLPAGPPAPPPPRGAPPAPHPPPG